MLHATTEPLGSVFLLGFLGAEGQGAGACLLFAAAIKLISNEKRSETQGAPQFSKTPLPAQQTGGIPLPIQFFIHQLLQQHRVGHAPGEPHGSAHEGFLQVHLALVVAFHHVRVGSHGFLHVG